MLILKSSLTKDGCISALLPKGYYLTDYSPTENLLELEDTNKGDRFWLEPSAIFRRDLKIGTSIFVMENSLVSTAIVKRFDANIFRKRCYALAVLEYNQDAPVPFDQNIHWSNKINKQ